MDLVIFDLDGTLVDSKQDLAQAVNATRKHCGLVPLDLETVSSYVGNGAPVLVRKALGPNFTEEEVQQALEYFLEYYRQHMLDTTTLYPGGRECLERLHSAGVLLSVLTNKPVRFSSDILEGLGVRQYFFRVYGGNSFEKKKPDPFGVETLLAEAGIPKSKALMVGDSAVDVRAARNAGIRICGVTYGFQPESLKDDPPDMLASSMEEVAELVLAERNREGEKRS
jgi:phosphoglycolate phosphatase